MPEFPLLVDARVRGLGELKQLSQALSQIAGASKVTRGALSQLQGPFQQAVTAAAPIRNVAKLAQEGLEGLNGAVANTAGKIRAVPPEVNRLLTAIDSMSRGVKVSAETLRRYGQAALEASEPHKRLHAVIQHLLTAFNMQQAATTQTKTRTQEFAAATADLQEVLRQINATIGISNSQIFNLLSPLQSAVQTFAPLMTQAEAARVGFTNLTGATAALQGQILAVPPTVNTLIALLSKLANGGQVNTARLLETADAAMNAAAGYEPLHSVLRMVTDAIRQQTIEFGKYSTAAKDAANGGGMFMRQNYEMSQSLMVSQSAAHGLMLGMGALNGSILQVAFSIIFLRFSNVQLSLAVGASIIAIGIFVKALKGLIVNASKAAASIEVMRRSLTGLTGSTIRANDMLEAIRRTSLDFGVAQEEVAKGFQKIRDEGAGTAEMLRTVGMYARLTGKDFMSAATEIAQAIGGNLDALTMLDDRTKRSMERVWEFRDANSRASWIIKQVGRDYKDLGAVMQSTTAELKTTISEGFGAIFAVLGRGLNTIFRPLLRGLAFLARLWANVMSQIEKNTVASVTVTILVFGLLGFALWKIIVVLKRLWVGIIANIKEFPIFIAKIRQAASTLITQLAPALGVSATNAERLAASLRMVGVAAPGATAGLAATGAAATGTAVAGTASVGILAKLSAGLKGIGRLLGPIAFVITGVLSLIEGLTNRTDRLNSVLRVTGGVISIIAGVLVAIGTLGIGTGAAIAMIGAGIALIGPAVHDATKATNEATESLEDMGRVIGHSPGLAQDIGRLGVRMSLAEVQTVEWSQKLKGLSSQLRTVEREARGFSGVKLADVSLGGVEGPTGGFGGISTWLAGIAQSIVDFFSGVPEGLSDMGTWLWENIGQPVANFFTVTVPEKLVDMGEWLWTDIGEPVYNFFSTTVPEKLSGIGDWLWDNIGSPVKNFFTSTVPTKFRQMGDWLWDNIGSPVKNFFTVTIPEKFGQIGDWLYNNILLPIYNFFTITVPETLSRIGDWLYDNIITPIVNFFTVTLPTLPGKIWNALTSVFSPVVDFFKGIFGGSTPTVPGLATGAIAMKPVIRRVGEVPEAIIPLSKLRGLVGGGVTVNVTGNYIMDDRTARLMADKVTEQVVRVMSRYRPIPATGISY